MDNARGQWKAYRGWLGTFVENVVQGTARDLLAAAIDRFETRGIPVVFHCHDEVTVEVPIGALADTDFLKILLELPAWATGLPLGGKVHSGPHYLEAPEHPAEPLVEPDPEAREVERAIDVYVEDTRQDVGPIDNPALVEREDDQDYVATLADDIAPLTELVGLPLTPDNKVACPFHDDVEPSCTIYPDHFHCLSGETKVMTWDGNIPIRDLTRGVHQLLTTGGEWVTAPVMAFGTQRLWRIALTRNGVRKDLYATDEHRWIVHGRANCILTKNLRVGHCLAAVFPNKNQAELDPEGVRHGIVFGDGTMDTNRNGLSLVYLWGNKGPELRDWFEDYPQRDPRYRPMSSVEIRRCPGHYKLLPGPNAPPDYLAGFLAGYLATDGHVAVDGTVMLHCVNAMMLEYVRLIATRLGIGTHSVTQQMRVGYGTQPSPIYRIHFSSEQIWADLFIRPQSSERFMSARKAYARHRWQVRSVEPTDRVEEVYCAQVPNTAAFTLEDKPETASAAASTGVDSIG
jgi:hypothetical protein